MLSRDKKQEWIAHRKSLVWEPEILISGIVLIGLLQVPQLLDRLQRYLNDWGPQVFFYANVDELLIAFLKTSVFFLVAGLIVNLFMRSIWVVMIGMSIVNPRGLDLRRLKFQPFYERKITKSIAFEENILKLEQLCSYIYSLTFFSFMCVIGIFFVLLIVGGSFMVISSIVPPENKMHWLFSNELIDFILKFLGALLLLDFISLGWFKRIKWLAWAYRPFYVLLSFLTLSKFYRGIYYSLISNFNKWKVFVSLIVLIFAIIYVWGIQQDEEFLFYQSKMYDTTIGVATFDGYYRDRNAQRMSSWMHIPSMHVHDDVLEVFVAHKAALEDSILSVYGRISGHSREEILEKKELKINAFSHYYRFQLNQEELPPVALTFINMSEYNQKGVVGFIRLDSLSHGLHRIGLRLNQGSDGIKITEIPFYKISDGANYQQKIINDAN
ncbi:MAG TPA: hypothetical protein PKC24_06950 [Cyclobacteriaceae bacterium]|nr:hypothetical protein [Cyclobacteriaceae bacterium]